MPNNLVLPSDGRHAVASLQACDRLLTAHEVTQITSLSRTTVWRALRAGIFPVPIRLTAGRIGWRESVVRAWIDERHSASLQSQSRARTLEDAK